MLAFRTRFARILGHLPAHSEIFRTCKHTPKYLFKTKRSSAPFWGAERGAGICGPCARGRHGAVWLRGRRGAMGGSRCGATGCCRRSGAVIGAARRTLRAARRLACGLLGVAVEVLGRGATGAGAADAVEGCSAVTGLYASPHYVRQRAGCELN